MDFWLFHKARDNPEIFVFYLPAVENLCTERRRRFEGVNQNIKKN